MKKGKVCHTDQTSPGGGKPAILLLPSKHFKYCSLSADAGLRISECTVFLRETKSNVCNGLCQRKTLILIAFQSVSLLQLNACHKHRDPKSQITLF